MRKFLNIVFVIMMASQMGAADFDTVFDLTNLSVNEGLSQFDATKVVQDKYGFIWISTYDGLNRYNGNGFEQFRHDPFDETSINGNRVITLSIDSDENLWVITEGGQIDRFNYKTEEFEHYHFEPLKYSIITVFFEDENKNYWIGTTNGIYNTSIKNKEFHVNSIFLNSSSPGSKNFIISVIDNEKGDILVGTVSGAVLLSKRGNDIFSASSFLDNIQMNSFCKDTEETLWLCTGSGLYYIEGDETPVNAVELDGHIRYLESFRIADIRAMAAVDKTHYILLSGNAIFMLDIQKKQVKKLKLRDSSFFENNVIKSVLVDRTQNVWISSGQKGIAKINLMQKSSLIKGKEQTVGEFVKSVFQDSKGRVWIGTKQNGMYYYDVDGIIKHLPIAEYVNQSTYIAPSLLEDKLGRIWFCANEDVFYFNYETNKVHSISSLYRIPNKAIHPFSLALDAFENLWIGYSSGVLRISMKDTGINHEFVSIGSLSDMVSSEQISRMLYDRFNNKMWICTKDNGVAVLSLDEQGEIASNTQLLHSADSNSIRSNHVWSILLASDSSIWLGTDAGLNQCTFKNGHLSISQVTEPQGIENVKVMSLVEDEYKIFWLGTSQALYSFDREANITRKYTTAKGLYSSAVLEGMYANKNGRVYVGTANGLNYVNTKPEISTALPAEVQIVDFKIFGKSIKKKETKHAHLQEPLYTTKKINLKYNESNFTISFLSMHYNDFDRNIYRYKLDGFENDSIEVDSKNSSVTYNKIPRGTYKFWVKASNNYNVWSNKKYLWITVEPPPWLTFWAYGIYFIIILGILGVFLYLINKKTKLKQQLVITDLENSHQKDINDMRLRVHTNVAHDIRTPLSLVSGPLEDIKHHKDIINNSYLNNRVEIIEKNVSRLLYLVNQFLDFRRLIYDSNRINSTTIYIPDVLNDVKNSFTGLAEKTNIRFEFIVDVNDDYLILDVDKLTKILFNLLSNAFKFTSEGGEVFVFIEQQNESIVMKISDTGCGIPNEHLDTIFERFYQSNESIGSTGIGLALVKQLVELCNGSIDVSSVEKEGTHFVVMLPCKIANEISVQKAESSKTDELKFAENETIEKNESKAYVLVVEDDDDLRNYLVLSLSERYSVIQAQDGQEGFAKALQYTPDIIITDIMMPKVDGNSFIRFVRNDHRTSHIPIVVLTAKVGDNEEIKALEAGAEDFITKPFSTKTLLLKVNNHLRNRYKGEKSDENIEIKMEDKELIFLNKFNNVVLDNFENPLFCIDFLCEKLAISRMQLHRKMISLLGKSTSEYIREIKLDEAKKMVEEGESDVQTLMIRIGVSSSFHFNKNFKHRHGMSMYEFIKQVTNKNR